jgi:hypothetical protein
MKSFQQFITEAYDKEMAGQASRAPGEGGRIRASRKKRDLDKIRTKAVGGGKTAPVKDYKPRKDIGTNKPRSRTQQQPEKPRGSAALSPREAQKKAAMERRAAKSGAKTKTADELLSKKKKTVSPKYKPVKATGYTTAERQKITRAGQRLVKDIKQGKEKPISQYDPGIRKS